MMFVDTGFFLAVSQPRDALHQRAMGWATVVAEPLVTSEPGRASTGQVQLLVRHHSVRKLAYAVQRAKACQNE